MVEGAERCGDAYVCTREKCGASPEILALIGQQTLVYYYIRTITTLRPMSPAMCRAGSLNCITGGNAHVPMLAHIHTHTFRYCTSTHTQIHFLFRRIPLCTHTHTQRQTLKPSLTFTCKRTPTHFRYCNSFPPSYFLKEPPRKISI